MLYRQFLEDSYYWSAEEILLYKQTRIRQLFEAARNIPHYSEALEHTEIKNSANPFSLLSQFGLLTRENIKEKPKDFLNQHKTSRAIIDHTSGSTGNPLTIYLTKKQKELESGYLFRYYSRFDYRIRDKVAVFRSYIPENKASSIYKFDQWRNELLFSVYHLSAPCIDQYIELFNRFQPRFVRGYPSSLYIVAKHILEFKRKIKSPVAIFCSSELLSDHYRQVISEAFCAPVYNWYGSNERALTASQCKHAKSLHVHEEAGILELVDEQGHSSLENGVEEGQVVVTGLVNTTMPLIRYKLGDYAVLDRRPCECGFNGLSIKEIIGRTDDIIVTSVGKSIPPVRFYTLFEKFPAVIQFQVIQVNSYKIEVLVATNATLNTAALSSQLEYFIGNDMVIDIQVVDQIPAEKSGKRKLIKVLKWL